MGIIFHTGMPGCGKTTVGRIVAAHLKTPFIDLDQEIERVRGKSISQMFVEDGEPAFRELEASTLLAAANRSDGVIALGGGTLMRKKSTQFVRKRGRLVFLAAPIDLLVSRTYANRQRPLLEGAKTEAELRERLNVLWLERREEYVNAQVIVFCGVTRSPEEIAEMIVARLSEL